jgi:hemin uptake protein HemP
MNDKPQLPTRPTLRVSGTIAAPPATDGSSAPSNMIESTMLLGAARLRHILHHGEVYILRQTRAGKLILTK